MKVVPYVIMSFICTLATVAYAEEKSLCPSLCTSEKKQCLSHAEADAKLMVDPIIRTNTERNTGESLSEYQAHKKADLRNVTREKSNACDQSYGQCVQSCRKDEQAPSTTATPAK